VASPDTIAKWQVATGCSPADRELDGRPEAGASIGTLTDEGRDTLGAYEVIALAGKGGMGAVYHARDTKLQRDVAIKILPALFARDPERLARFEREARRLAARSITPTR
jgi:serine/threonine protein kinase